MHNFFHIILLIISLAIVGLFNACSNRCAADDCNNRGFCYEGECLCDKWYSGQHCDLAFNRNYAGVYVGEAFYANGGRMRNTDSLILEASQVFPNRLHEPEGMYLILENDSALIIPSQRIIQSGDTFWIEGTGRHEVGSINIEYTRYSEINSEAQVTTPVGLIRFSGSLIEREQ